MTDQLFNLVYLIGPAARAVVCLLSLGNEAIKSALSILLGDQ
jgi:hypothetical protein